MARKTEDKKLENIYNIVQEQAGKLLKIYACMSGYV